jgi:RimJ/RimL family protein N-acetyltransferase
LSTDAQSIDTEAEAGLRGLPYEAVDIRTERLLLRPLKRSDLADVVTYQKRKDVFRYLLWEARDHEEPAKRFEKRLALTRLERDGDGLIFAVELPDPSGAHGRVIGDVSVYLKSIAGAQLEVGWVFHPAVHGRGLATEAAQAILKLCFETLGAHRVYAELDARNEAAARLCGILGMRHEGVLRGNELFRGEWIDTSIHAILDTEFTG